MTLGTRMGRNSSSHGEVEIGRGSCDATWPTVAIETWIKFTKRAHGALFRRVAGQGKAVGADRLNDRKLRGL
jgi:hypothetical protein